MTEIRTEVKTFMVEWPCDGCSLCRVDKNTVTYQPPSLGYIGKRDGYLHRCDTCGFETYLSTTYPRIEYAKVPV